MNKELQFLIYDTPQENVKIDVVVKDETIWLTQKAMASLFDVQVPAISKHLKNIYKERELSENTTISKMETVVNRGFMGEVNELIDFYNLDAIISVGYRVNSAKATQFRIWANKVLKEYMIKGFVLDDERLKQGKEAFGKDYFRELLERVRSIRASERRIWQQITDIFAECSLDYDENSQVKKDFFATVQNKFHYAITGQTAAEIIYNKADRKRENMGLTTWKNSPDGRVLKSDLFYRQKICWKAVGRNLTFSLVEPGVFLTAPASFITSNYNLYILAFLCSKVAKYFIFQNSDTTGSGDIMLNIQSLVKFPIPKLEINQQETISNLIMLLLNKKKNRISIEEIEKQIDAEIYELYNFNKVEILKVESV